MALTAGEMDAIMGALQHEVPSEHADGSQYIEGAFVAFAVLGQQVAALNEMVSRLKATNANYKHTLNQTDAQNAHLAQCYEALQQKHETVCRELAQAQEMSWTNVQDLLTRAGVTQVRRGTALWYVYSVRTPRCGTGESLLAAIADLDAVPELP